MGLTSGQFCLANKWLQQTEGFIIEIVRQSRVRCVLKAEKQMSTADQDLKEEGCGISPLNFHRGQSQT